MYRQKKLRGSVSLSALTEIKIPVITAFSADEKYIMVEAPDTTHLIDLESSEIIKSIPLKFTGQPICQNIAFNGDKQSFIFYNDDGYITEWPLSSLIKHTGIGNWVRY